MLHPELVAQLTEKEREKIGAEINPAVEALIPGGWRSAAHLGSRGGMQEMFRQMLLPTQAVDKDGKPVPGDASGAAQPSGSRLENDMPAM